MGEKFKDFPCFYYLDGRINKKNRLQFYSMLAAMFGQTPESAAQTSELFAHASGKLFGGAGYSVDEIKKEGGTYFEKPYKDCRGFYRRKAYDEAGLKDNCCVICPYSHSFLNNCIEQERQALHILSKHRDWFQIANCSTSDFRSRLAISCTNDISEYPAIPFHAYFLEFLLRNEEVTEDAVTDFVRDALTANGQHVPDNVLAPFIATQLGIISRTATGGDDTSTLLFALNTLREDRYAPPQLVQPESQTVAKKEKKARPASNAIEELARLFSDIDNMHFVTKPKKETIDTLVPEETVANDTASPINQDEDVANNASEDDTDMLEKLLSTLSDDRVEEIEPVSPPEPVVFSEEEVVTDVIDLPVDEPESFSIAEEEEDATDEETLTPSVEDPAPESTTSTVKITTLPDHIPAADEEDTDTPADKPGVAPCDVCHGISPESYPFADEWQKNLYKHCMACENAIANGNEKPFHSVVTNHPPLTAGCAFCGEGGSADCIYNDTPISLSEDFASIVHDCSDYMGNLSNLVALMDACNEAETICIECVRMYGIEGVLLYVCGTYYFIGGGTTACAGLKQIFSDAGKHKVLSLNPLLVHVKLLRFGLRLTKIESLAVMYSVFVGTDVLLPPGVFFVTGHDTDPLRSFMPQYDTLFSRLTLTDTEATRYEKLKRLEWALASSVDTSFIATGKNRSVYGSNALNYRFALLDEERICREGTLYVVTLDKSCELPPSEATLLWEDVASRLAASSLSCMNYAFILGIGNGISYFTCFEEEAFFDSLMASARAAYKKAYKKEVHLQVVSERYCTLSSAAEHSKK